MDQSKHQIALKCRRMQKKRGGDTHRGASNTRDNIIGHTRAHHTREHGGHNKR